MKGFHNNSFWPASTRYQCKPLPLRGISSQISENQILKTQIDILQNLRSDFVQNYKFNEAINIDSKFMQNPYLLNGKLKNGMHTLWDFASNNLAIKPSERKYIFEWYQVMSAYVELHSLQNHWKYQREQIRLGQTIRSALIRLQNNDKCKHKFVRCSSYRECGFGCLIHHFTFCLITALALNRTLILNNEVPNIPIWHALVPIKNQDECLNERIQSNYETISWNVWVNQQQTEPLIIELSPIENIVKRMPFQPLAIPEQLRDQLEYLSQVPFVLFVGHIVNYIFNLNEQMWKKIHVYYSTLNLSSIDTLIGLHIRRTDKIFESDLFSMSAYMVKVAEYYDRLELQHQLSVMNVDKTTVAGNTTTNSIVRRVYLATDDESVWRDEVPTYVAQGYHFYGNPKFAFEAAPENRYNPSSVESIAIDLYMLSLCDHLVCTLSSNICRLAYELMQVRKPRGRDMSSNVDTLDDVYYFGGQAGHGMEAIIKNKVQFEDEFDQHQFDHKDVLGIYKDLHNGFLMGDLQVSKDGKPTSKIRKYPKFKVKEKVVATKFYAFD
ncbi:hypothetical protein RDWZM_008241 [Blomia tropicalis]|uniref:GT23 domain-containing protein n=1 Tax=Blomia tropicalis TaxID=40697 RepID=A0A9Q0M1C1_BLOTA|nr:hypothetical protein RDWZM_008241 [Blomia tropicalis]